MFMVPIHPGRILKCELKARSLFANQLALALRVPSGRITAIFNKESGVTADTALRLGRYFSTSAQFWMTLQSQYDLAIAEQKKIGAMIAQEVHKPG